MTKTTTSLIATATLSGLVLAGACKKSEKPKAKEEKKPAATAETPPAAETPRPTPATPPAPEVLKIEGMKTPESVLYDPDADVYLVSNINGTPFDKDDNGFIARVSPPPDAKIADPAWIDGSKKEITLNAPKGMAFLGDVLYVADIDTVRMFDRKTGAPKGEVKVPGAVFLNDMVAGKDSVFVSDTALDPQFKAGPKQGIYEIKGGKAKQLAKGPELSGPNGLLTHGDQLWAVTFGANQLYQLKNGKPDAVEKMPAGGLDGVVEAPDGRFLVSSWEGKAVYAGKPGSGATWAPIVENVTSPADIGLDTKRSLVLVPIFQENRIELHPLGGDK